MRNTLALLAAVVVIVLALGYFLNWYSLVGIESQGGSHRLQIDVNTSKIKSDIDKGKTKLQQTIEEFKESADEPDVHGKLPSSSPDQSKEPVFRF
jgi:hypothetical protein